MEPKEMEDLITTAEAAQEVGVAQGTITRWVKEGKLRGVRVGFRRLMVSRKEVKAMRKPYETGTEEEEQ